MPTVRLTETSLEGDRHRIQLELEAGGRRWSAASQFEFALSEQDREDLRWYLEDYLTYPIDPAPVIAARVEQRMNAIGAELHTHIFDSSSATARLWNRVEPELEATRVEVVTDVTGVTAIPWELLRDPLTNTPLALQASAFVRRNRQPARLVTPPDQAVERLRVLLVICRPGGRDDVPFRSVASHLVRVSDDARQAFELDVLRPPTFARLGQVLRAAADRGQPYHVVHFDGHGTWVDLAQQKERVAHISPLRYGEVRVRSGPHGYLLFEEPDSPEAIRYINGPELGDLLAHTGVPVLVLNACSSAHAELATTPEEAAAHVRASQEDPHARIRAYGSLAQEVIDQGVAGVVAMRYTVYVATAARFVGELYSSLLAGQQLGEAVSRGRQHLAADPTREIALRPLALQDWMVPIVYESAPLPVVAAPTSGQVIIQVGRAATGLKGVEAETTLPGPPEVGFYGRDETLLALDRAFDTQQIVLLHGFAGAGKTTTAAEFARWYERTGGLVYEGGDGSVLFTAFTRHRPLALVLDQVGQVFGEALEAAGVPWGALDERQRRQVAVQVLGQVPVLWIWDNVEPVTGFPEGTPSAWTAEEQDELRGFLADLQKTRARVLLTSRRQEHTWLGELAIRVALPSMPMAERVQLARAVANKHGRRLAEMEDLRPLLAYTQGNPLTVTVLVGQALREGLRTREQTEQFVARLQAGEQQLADDEREGRSRSLGASLGYGFTHAFGDEDRAQLALLHLFQGFVDVDALCAMGHPQIAGEPVAALRGLTREQGIRMLDRAAEVGLLSGYGAGYYAIHPTLPWYFADLFSTAYGPTGSPAALQATHAYSSAIAALGNYYHDLYGDGRRELVSVLGAEEANLRHARRLARTHGWWDQVMGAMQGLRVLYGHTGRRLEWARLVEELVPDLVDPASDGPRPGREDQWALMTEYRVRIAQEQQDWVTAERLQRAAVAWDREQATAAMAMPPARLDSHQRNQIRSVAVSLQMLGRILREQQQRGCVDAYTEALELVRRIGDRQAEASTAFNLGNVYLEVPEVRDLDKAEHWYRHSIALLDESDRLGRARCIGQLGSLNYQRFNAAQAQDVPETELLVHLNAASTAYREAIDELPSDAIGDLAIIYNQCGAVYRSAGKLDTAMGYYREAVNHYEAMGNRYGAGLTRYNLALTLADEGRIQDALLWAQAALRDFQTHRTRVRDDIARTEQLIAGIEQEMAEGPTGPGRRWRNRLGETVRRT